MREKQLEFFLEVLKVVIPSTISIVGFVVTVYINKANLKSELRKQHLEKYLDNYKNIEFDIAEILQLSVREYLGNDVYVEMEYVIQKHRLGEFKETSNIGERLYRLGGYISTYSSKKIVNQLNIVRKVYVEHSKLSVLKRKEKFSEFVSLLAILLLQIKREIFKEKRTIHLYDEMDWLNTRLPIQLVERYQVEIREYLEKNWGEERENSTYIKKQK